MANTFNNADLVCTTSLVTFYTCPGGVASVVLLLQATNVTNRADVLTVVWNKSSDGHAIHLTDQVPVPAQQSIGCLTGKLVLLPGDTLQAQCGIFNAIELAASFLETS